MCGGCSPLPNASAVLSSPSADARRPHRSLAECLGHDLDATQCASHDEHEEETRLVVALEAQGIVVVSTNLII